MSATPEDVSSQMPGAPPTDFASYMALATPPPMDEATINKLEAQIPKPQHLTAPPAPMSSDQEQATRADISSKVQSQVGLDKAAIRATEEAGEQQARLSEAEIASMESAQPPEMPQQNSNPLQRMAPLLLLTAFGGKLTKLDANAMLGATMGTVNGYLAGNEEMYEKAQQQYQEAYKRFQDREKQRAEIFDKMHQAYSDRADAHIKALQMSYQLTGDQIAVDQDRLKAQEQWHAAVDKIAEQNHKEDNEYYDRRARLEMARRKSAQADSQVTDDQLRTLAQTAIKTGHDPGFGMGQSTVRNRYQAIKADEIKRMGGSDEAVGAAARTRLANAEASTLGRQKANLDRVEHALTDTGGVGDQAMAAAKKLSPSQLRTFNKLSQLFQRETSDPTLADYRLKMLALRDEFATVINRGGQPTEGSRQQATEEMDKFQVNAVPAIVQAIKDIAGANSRALDSEIQQLGRTQPSVKSFATDQDAATAAAAGQIKKGDRITVNGISGTWQ